MKPTQSRIVVYMAWILLFSFAYFGIYMVKYNVQEKKNQLELVERQLREEKKNLHVLAAEWTFLNRTDRLRRLSDKYLGLTPVHGKQMADFASLPYAPSANVASTGQETGDGEGAPLAAPTLASPVAFTGAAHGQ